MRCREVKKVYFDAESAIFTFVKENSERHTGERTGETPNAPPALKYDRRTRIATYVDELGDIRRLTVPKTYSMPESSHRDGLHYKSICKLHSPGIHRG
jgi:hypothetical protein